jgi:hypothetical protein
MTFLNDMILERSRGESENAVAVLTRKEFDSLQAEVNWFSPAKPVLASALILANVLSYGNDRNSSLYEPPMSWYGSTCFGQSEVDKLASNTKLGPDFQVPKLDHELRLSRYLDEISIGSNRLISREMADRAHSLWVKLVYASGPTVQLEVPNAMAGQQGELLFIWDNGAHRFEVDFFGKSRSEFIYLGPQSEADWEFVYQDGDPIPPEAIEKLKLFQRNA